MDSPFFSRPDRLNDPIDGRSEPISPVQALFRLALICWLLALGACRQPETDESRLRAALARVRPGEGRLVGAPWLAITQVAPEALPSIQEGPLTRSAGPGPNAAADTAGLRIEALSHLLVGRVDLAISGLAKACSLNPADATLWSDLAAARLQRAAAARDPYEIVLALAAANRAVRLAPDLPPARFNRALALEHLSLLSHAEREWQAFLPLETDPGWIAEASTRARSIKHSQPSKRWSHNLLRLEAAVRQGQVTEIRALVNSHPQHFREYVEETLLGRWAQAVGQGEPGNESAEQSLAVARSIGSALAENGVDRMIADTVAQIDESRNGSARRQALAAGFQAYKMGLETANFAEALPHFIAARKKLLTARSPFAIWAAYKVALCHYQQNDLREAGRFLGQATNEAGQRYAAVHGRSLWLSGLIDSIQGRPSTAIRSFRAARGDFRSLGELVYVARLQSLEAEALEYLGQTAEAWRLLYFAIRESSTSDQPQTQNAIFQLAAWFALKQGETEMAALFQDEVVRTAGTDVPYRIAIALRERSEILAKLGEKTRAREDISTARYYLSRISDPGIRQGLEGDLSLAEAEVVDTPQEAAGLLDRAIQVFQSSSYHYRLAQTLFARSRIMENLGRFDDMERDLATAIDELERQREQIPDPEARISYFDRARQALDTMLLLQLEWRRRPDLAFLYSEQAKARTLLDWVVSHPIASRVDEKHQSSKMMIQDLHTLQNSLPPATVILEYAVLERVTIVWVLSKGEFKARTIDINSTELSEMVHRLRQEMEQRRKGDFLKTSSQLYDLLIHPVGARIRANDRIVIVPDGVLHGLPFSVLRNRRAQKYLIENHILSVAPSARLLIASLQRDAQLQKGASPRALAFADPDFDQELFPLLQRLTASNREESLARDFPGSVFLSDKNATREAFLRDGGRFEIVHFGGHSLVNPDYPLLSQMILAPTENDPDRGVLYSGTILGHRFDRTRLVVLASCSTASGKVSETEGAQSLARPFLATGVPAVVASLWDVGDSATAEFFQRFYSNLKRSFDPAWALQQTQVESLARGSAMADPAGWGAFEILGATSMDQ